MNRILSIDASTTTIAFSVLEFSSFDDVKLVYYEYFKPPKKDDIFIRLAAVRDFIFSSLTEWEPQEVVLEDILLFMKGHSTAKTISSLAALNRTVGLAIYNCLGKPPHLLNVRTVRSLLKKDHTPEKEEMPELVAEYLKIDFPWKYNKLGNKAVENYDISDAISVGLAWIKSRQPKPKIKKSKKNIII